MSPPNKKPSKTPKSKKARTKALLAIKTVSRRRRNMVLQPANVASNVNLEHHLARLYAILRSDVVPTQGGISVGDLPDALVRPAVREVEPAALSAAVMDPTLELVGPANVRRYLGEISNQLYSVMIRSEMPPISASRSGDLPKFVPVTVPEGTAEANFPTHMLAVHTSQALTPGSKRKVLIFPVHALVLAATCWRMPRIPATPVAPDAPSHTTRYLPLLPFSVPAPDVFAPVLAALYLGHIEPLARALLPAGADMGLWVRPEGASGVAHLAQLKVHLAATYCVPSLLELVSRVHGVWQNACSLGIINPCVWGLIDLAWRAYAGAFKLARR